MLPSPFTFYRGSAGVMAADLAGTPSTGIRVQLCGDAHLANFGGFATPERNIVFDINDFDETIPGPWEWDLKRLATSFVLAMRSNGLPDDAGRDAAMRCARAYRKAMRNFAEMNPLDLWYTRIDVDEFVNQVPDPKRRNQMRKRLEKIAAKRGSDLIYPKVTEVVGGEVTIKDAPPLIYHPEVARLPEFREQAEEILRKYGETLTEERRALLDRFQFVDAALKVVGVGSVGTRCWIALLMSRSNEPLFLQLKQANPSVLAPYAGGSSFPHNGQRIVAGQRLMQAASDLFLGWTTGPNAEFYVRQLRDVKIKPLVETFDEMLFTVFAKGCAWTLARAHARSGDAPAIAGYLGKSREFDEAIGDFSVAYANQAERDHAALKRAVRAGQIEAYTE